MDHTDRKKRKQPPEHRLPEIHRANVALKWRINKGRSAGFVIAATLLTLNLRPAMAQAVPRLADHITSGVQLEALDQQSLGAAEIGEARVLMPLALDLIKDYERWRNAPYNDASNYCTIGYGHLIAKEPCEKPPASLARYSRPLGVPGGLKLLDDDTRLARLAVQSLTSAPLTDEQYGALVSLVFNIGARNFANSTLLRAVNNQEFDAAGLEFGRWVRSGGKVMNGLVGRRACEAALFSGKLHYRPNGRFYRQDCDSLGAAPAAEDLIDIGVGEGRR